MAMDMIHLQRLQKLTHVPEVEWAYEQACNWQRLCELLGQRGWRVVTPELVAGLAPDLTRSHAWVLDADD